MSDIIFCQHNQPPLTIINYFTMTNHCLVNDIYHSLWVIYLTNTTIIVLHESIVLLTFSSCRREVLNFSSTNRLVRVATSPVKLFFSVSHLSTIRNSLSSKFWFTFCTLLCASYNLHSFRGFLCITEECITIYNQLLILFKLWIDFVHINNGKWLP